MLRRAVGWRAGILGQRVCQLRQSLQEPRPLRALIRVRDKWYIKEDATVYELPCGIETMRGEFYMAFYRPDKLLA